ncbi:MAG: DUF938 domain-containing protein [Planctomycetota bacterium]
MKDKPRAVRMEALDSEPDGRRYSPSAGRNRQEIVEALTLELPVRGDCLEVAAGTGEHAVLAASKLPGWTWLPTDRDAEALASARAWVAKADLPNLRAPAELDLGADKSWPCARASLDAVFASNVMHISPMATTESLFRGAAVHLRASGVLLVYGAVFLPGEPRPDGNVAFDVELREQDPEYGVRTLTQLAELAVASGLREPVVRRMQNNNVLLRFAVT